MACAVANGTPLESPAWHRGHRLAAKSLRPIFLPGEPMKVKIVKPGESAWQGVGYHEDGTMVVVENSRGCVGEEVDLVVTSTIQAAAGRMIFGRQASTLADTPPIKPEETTPDAADSGDHKAGHRPQEERARLARQNPRRK